MFSSTIRFIEASSPAASIAPLLSTHSDSSNQVLIGISGDSVAVFNVAHVKRTATWPLHPKTMFTNNPVIHTPSNVIYAPIRAHVDLPTAASSKTIWAWPWDSVVRHRSELTMDSVIHALFAPHSVPNHLIVVHLNAQVSLVSHDLKSVATYSLPCPNEDGLSVRFASDFNVDGTVYLVVVTSAKSGALSMSVSCINEGSEFTTIYTAPLTTSPRPTVISFHAPSRHLALLYPSEIQSVVVPISRADAKTDPLVIAIPQSMGKPLNCTALSPDHIAFLHELPTAPSSDKSTYAVSLYTTQFGTWQGSTVFDLDLVSEITKNSALKNHSVTSAMVVVKDHILVSLGASRATVRERSKAVLLRCTAQISHVSLLSVIGRNRVCGSVEVASTSSVSAVLPGTSDVSDWRASIDRVRKMDQGALSSILRVTTAAELESLVFGYIDRVAKAQGRQVPELSATVVCQVLSRTLSSPLVYSARVLEWLCDHHFVSGTFTTAALSDRRTESSLLRVILDHAPSTRVVKSVLRNVRDIPESDLVYLVHQLCTSVVGEDTCMEFDDPRSVLQVALAYPHTDVYVHAALERYDTAEALMMVQALTLVLNEGTVDVGLVVPMASHVLDAHLTKILVAASTSDNTKAIKAVLSQLQSAIGRATVSLEASEDAMGMVGMFLRSVQLEKERRQKARYVTPSGRVRERGILAEKGRYVIEVLHF